MRRSKLVAYYRVSTDKQGRSRLGLEAQQALVAGHAAAVGGQIVAAYTEVESGKRTDRTELQKAIAHAKRARGTLVIAKLDRLARNVHFISGLMETGVEFVACDCPGDDRFMIHVRASFAEEEGRKIGERTRAALAAYKARGGLLGAARPDGRRLSPDDTQKGREAAREAIRSKADAAYADLVPMVAEMRTEGRSLRNIADVLNAEGHTTRQGRPWNPVQVGRVLGRADV